MNNDVIDVRAIDAQRAENLKSWGWVSYILHLIVAVGAVVPGAQASVTLLIIALVLDLVKRDDARGTWQESHFSWRIRSVLWAGLLYVVTAPLFLLFYLPGAPSDRADWNQAKFHHKASGQYFEMSQRAGDRFIKRYRMEGGRPVDVLERRVTHVMGSGERAISYLHQTSEGRIFELPVHGPARTTSALEQPTAEHGTGGSADHQQNGSTVSQELQPAARA